MASIPARPLEGARLQLFSRYPASGASSRLRMLQYLPALEAAGASVAVSPFFDQAYLDRYYAGGGKSRAAAIAAYMRRARAVLAADVDLTWVEKELFPFLPGAVEWLAARGRGALVVDYDDAIFHNYDRHHSPIVRRLLGRKLDPLLRRSDLVTAGNAYLEDYARRHGARRILRLPTVVDAARYPASMRPPDAPLRIGWIGSPANARYVDALAPALTAVHARAPFTLVLIGADPRPMPGVPQEAHTWSAETEASLLATIDIGIMPLPDDPFERGKCAYKLIQYMAAGRPVVASPVGANGEVVTDRVGFLADGEDAWRDALLTLARDSALRARMGAAGRDRVARHYALDHTAPRLIEAFAAVTAAARR